MTDGNTITGILDLDECAGIDKLTTFVFLSFEKSFAASKPTPDVAPVEWHEFT